MMRPLSQRNAVVGIIFVSQLEHLEAIERRFQRTFEQSRA